MDTPPPILDAPPEILAPPVRPRWRSVLFFLIVGPYPLLLGPLASWIKVRAPAEAGSPSLPESSSGLLAVCGENLAIFGLLFALGAFFGRPKLSELYIRRIKWMDWVWGALWSVGLRIVLMVIMLFVVMVVFLAQGGGDLDIASFRPKIENLINPKALADPIYLLLSMTAVSMVTAGMREELWRTGCMAPLISLLPASWKEGASSLRGWRNWRTHRARWLACGVAAIIFGLGHWPQGLPGMLATGALGIGLGLVMIYYRSFWVAALAHGLLDATTFGFLGLLQAFAPQIMKEFFGK